MTDVPNTSVQMNQGNAPYQVAHFTNLKESYQAVGARTWLSEDFKESNLEISRNLFSPESLQARKPRPKELEVFALLSGLPFVSDFTDKLVAVQTQISEILGERLHYWVAPQNMGVEYCVFKWPTDSWEDEWLSTIQNVLASFRPPSFRFHIGGVQVNPDGCVVARGYDEHAAMFLVRDRLKSEVPFLPEKQSRWAHVPLGRILEPLGVEQFARLANLVGEISDLPIASTKIDTMKLIHETRWYMEERNTLAEYALSGSNCGRSI
jgi:hypothetical protein